MHDTCNKRCLEAQSVTAANRGKTAPPHGWQMALSNLALQLYGRSY